MENRKSISILILSFAPSQPIDPARECTLNLEPVSGSWTTTTDELLVLGPHYLAISVTDVNSEFSIHGHLIVVVMRRGPG